MRSSHSHSFDFGGERLHQHWARLHRGDREPWPDDRQLERLTRGHAARARALDAQGGAAAMSARLQDAWRQFHAGDFKGAIRSGIKAGPFGTAAANKAAALLSTHTAGAAGARLLEEAIERGETAVLELAECPNSHYFLALVLGRHAQRISILEALAQGLGPRIRKLLEHTLELEPRHAEAHLALALWHAEIVGKLGSLAAGLTYGASRSAGLAALKASLRLDPDNPIVAVEGARAHRLLEGHAGEEPALELLRRAAASAPADAAEALDAQRARADLAAA